MLSAATYAIWLADNPPYPTCQVPDTFAATFQAGVYNGFTGNDLRSEFEACFVPDQHIADEANDFVQAMEA